MKAEVALSETLPSWSFSKSQQRSAAPPSQAPGPGQYSPSRTKESPTWAFGRSAKGEPPSKSKEFPAPGTYDVPTTLDRRSCSISGRCPDLTEKRTAFVPGPGAYSPALPPDNPQFSVSRGSRWREDRRKSAVPGPGTYESFRPRSTSVVVGRSQRQGITQPSAVPGPGSYTVQKDTEGPRFSFAGRHPTATKSDNPGPGQYDHTTYGYVLERPQSAAWGADQSTRISISLNRTLPGPGEYSPGSLLGEGPNYRFGTEQRKWIKEDLNPGPGTYAVKAPADPRAASISGRHPVKDYKVVPGPGTYEVKPGKDTPSFSVGRGQRSTLRSSSEAPGPGQYPTRDTLSRQGVRYRLCRIGTSRRDAGDRPSAVPGPGNYTTPTNIGEGPHYSLRGKFYRNAQQSVPGPGAYQQDADCIMEKSPSVQFGRESKDGLKEGKSTDSTGPGMYYSPGKPSGVKWSFGTEKKGTVTKSDGPGPGTYELKSTISDVPTYIGDILYLRFPDPKNEASDAVPVLRNGLEGFLADSETEDISFGLFRLEPYIPPTILTAGRTREFLAHSEEAKRLLDVELRYGMDFMLRHVYSGQLLYCDLNTASEDVSTWRISVGKADAPGSCTLVRFLPCKSSAKEGARIAYSAAVHVAFVKSRTSLFLNTNSTSLTLNGSPIPKKFTLSLYVSGKELNTNSVRPGLPITIQHANSGEYLRHSDFPGPVSMSRSFSCDTLWVCECLDSTSPLIEFQRPVRVRHAFAPLYFTARGTVEDDRREEFTFTWNRTGCVENGGKVNISTSPTTYLGLNLKKSEAYLFSHLLPFTSQSAEEDASVQEATPPSFSTHYIFTLSHLDEDKTRVYMEVKATVSLYENLLKTVSQSRTALLEIPRALAVHRSYISTRLHEQFYIDTLIAFRYHETIFHLIYELAKAHNDGSTQMIRKWLKTLRVLAKKHHAAADFISQKSDEVKELVKLNYFEAGRLYCSMIKVSPSLPVEARAFFDHWSSEIRDVTDENILQQVLYMKILASACHSSAKEAPEMRALVEQFLRKRTLMEIAECEQAQLVSFLHAGKGQPLEQLQGPLRAYLCQAIMLYSAAGDSRIANAARITGDVLKRAIGNTLHSPDVRKAFSILRTKILVTPAEQFLEKQDQNFLYRREHLLKWSRSVRDLPWIIGESDSINSVGEEIWRAFTTADAVAVTSTDVISDVSEEISHLMVLLEQTKAVLNECKVSSLFLHVVKVGVACILWGFSPSAKRGKCPHFGLYQLVMKVCGKDPPGKLQAKTQNQMGQLLQEALTLYTLITKIAEHRRTDELVQALYTAYSADDSHSDDTAGSVKVAIEKCREMMNRDEIGEWGKHARSALDWESVMAVEAQLVGVKEFLALAESEGVAGYVVPPCTPDIAVIWSLLTCSHLHSMTPAIHLSANSLLVRLLFPLRTLQKCLEKSVIVDSFDRLTELLSQTISVLSAPSTFAQLSTSSGEDTFRELKTVCSLLLARVGSREFRKVQAIMRNMKLHTALAPYIIYASRHKGEGCEILRALCATFMYRFSSDNKLNRKALLEGLTEPVQFWEVPQFVMFIRENADMTDLSLKVVHRFFEKVLKDLMVSVREKRKFCVEALTLNLLDRDEPNSDRQHVLCRLVLSKSIAEYSPAQLGIALHCLSACCLKNGSVVLQCRSLLSTESLAASIKQEFDMEMLKEYIDFYRFVYLQKLDAVPRTCDLQSTVTVIAVAWGRAFAFAKDKEQFELICGRGWYQPVRCYHKSYLSELAFTTAPRSDFLGAWRLLHTGNKHSEGLLAFLSDAASIDQFKRAPELLSLLSGGIVYELDYLLSAVQSMRRQFHTTLLEERLMATYDNVMGVLGYPQSPHLSDPNVNIESDEKSDLALLRQASSSADLFPSDTDILRDETYDSLLSQAVAEFQSAYRTKGELAVSVSQFWRSPLCQQSRDLPQFIASARALLYDSQRDLFFQLLTQVMSIDPRTDKEKTQSHRADLFSLARKEGLFTAALNAVLGTDSMKVQSAAMVFINELVVDQSQQDLALLRGDLKEVVTELFLTFYTAVAALTGILQSKKFSRVVKKIDMEILLDKESFLDYTAEGVKDQRSVLAIENAVGSRYLRKNTVLVTEMCRFIRNVCDNLTTDWQSYFRDQQTAESMDIVTVVADFVSALGRYPVFCVNSGEGRKVMMEGIGALVELASGSGNDNQTIILQTVGLYPVLNSLIESVFAYFKRENFDLDKPPGDESEDHLEVVDLFGSVCQLLIALTETDRPELFADTLLEFLRFDMIVDQLFWLYYEVIEKFLDALSVGEAPKSVESLVANAVYLRIVLVKLSAVAPTPLPLQWITDRSKVAPRHLGAFEFYERYTGSVEITENSGAIQTLRFPVPFKAFFLTPYTFQQLIVEFAELPQQEKFEAFLKNHVQCHDEMKHQQRLSANTYLKMITGHWKLYGNISIIALLFINMFMVLFFKKDEILGFVEDDQRKWVREWMRFLGFMQFLMGVSSYLCNFYEYIPEYTKSYAKLKQKFSFKDFCKQEDNASLLQYEQLRQEAKEKKRTETKQLTCVSYLLVCLQPRSFYFLFYLLFSVFGFFWYICYSILLLDSIRRFESLTRLLRAIVSTWQQLLITLAFQTMIIFIFATIGFLKFAGYYEDEKGTLLCDSLLNCFLSTIKSGLTQGGIGGVLGAPSPEDYWSRMTFDILFWSVVIVIMLSITFGIIIDSYSGLREEYRMTLETLASKCFICGEERSNIESHGEIWEEHNFGVHDPQKYIHFLIYLVEKPDKDCSGTEKAIKNKFLRYDVSFFPTTSKKIKDSETAA